MQERLRADVVRKEAEAGALIREFEDTKAQNSELKAELEALRRRAKQGQEEERAKVRALRGQEQEGRSGRACRRTGPSTIPPSTPYESLVVGRPSLYRLSLSVRVYSAPCQQAGDRV